MKRDPLQSRIPVLLIWAGMIAGLAPLHITAQSGFSGDLMCLSNHKPFWLPGVCERACPAHANLANLNALNYGGVNGATFCDFKAATPALTGDERMRQFYDLAVLNKIVGGRPVPRDPPKLVLVAHIINTYYTPYKASAFAIGFGSSSEKWAGLTPGSRSGASPDLTINDDLFWLTPAFVVSVLVTR